MKSIPAPQLGEMVHRLVDQFQPEEIILFGSHAWGTPTDDSDVDILVIVTTSAEKLVQRARHAHRCLRGIPVPTDVLVRTRAEIERFRHVSASLEAEILNRGKVVYGRESGARAGLAHQGVA